MNKKKKPNLSRKEIAQISLSDKCKSVVLGSLLGDGSLKKEPRYANLRFKMRHSEVQKDYFEWKKNLLQEIATEKSVQIQKPDGYSLRQKYLFQSSARPQLTKLWEKVSNKNKMVIERHWLNHLTPLSLAVWWFDDGSLTAKKRKGVFCTDNFSKEECDILSQYLKKVWDINANVRPIKRKQNEKNTYTRELYYRLWLNNTEIRKLLTIVLPYAETSFTVKKCLLVYADSDFQQRWISNMRGLLSQEGLNVLDDLLKDLDLNEFVKETLEDTVDLCELDISENNEDATPLEDH